MLSLITTYASPIVAAVSAILTIVFYMLSKNERVKLETPRIILSEGFFLDRAKSHYVFADEHIVFEPRSVTLSNYLFTHYEGTTPKPLKQRKDALLVNLSEEKQTPQNTSTKDQIIITKYKIKNIGGPMRSLHLKMCKIIMEDKNEIKLAPTFGDYYYHLEHNKDIEMLQGFFISNEDKSNETFMSTASLMETIKERATFIEENFLNKQMAVTCEKYTKIILYIVVTSTLGDEYRQRIIIQLKKRRYATWIEEGW